jgi:hypothetical protein
MIVAIIAVVIEYASQGCRCVPILRTFKFRRLASGRCRVPTSPVSDCCCSDNTAACVHREAPSNRRHFGWRCFGIFASLFPVLCGQGRWLHFFTMMSRTAVRSCPRGICLLEGRSVLCSPKAMNGTRPSRTELSRTIFLRSQPPDLTSSRFPWSVSMGRSMPSEVFAPSVWLTDKLRSYGAARRELGLSG